MTSPPSPGDAGTPADDIKAADAGPSGDATPAGKLADGPDAAEPSSVPDVTAELADAEILGRLGWDAGWQAARAVADPELAWQPVRIAAEHRGAYHALGPGGVAWVELTGRAFLAAGDKRALPTVGDWVLVERWRDAVAGAGAATVRAILPRRSFLVRRAAGEATVPQPLAANVDTGLVMTSANADLSVARLDRYISLLRDGGVAPVIVLSKVDLIADPAPLLARLAALVAPTPAPDAEPGAAPSAPAGEPDAPSAAPDPAAPASIGRNHAAGRVIAISTVTGAGLDAIRALGGPGTTCVLLGSSGVGKSSLLNAAAGTDQVTRAIRGDARGRHTTTRRELFVSTLDGVWGAGGVWIDTPGMRELGQWIEDQESDDLAFADIAELAQRCKFRDCGHHNEPGCAVRAAIPADRLASFHKLATERRTGATRQTLAQKLAETRRAKAKKPTPPSDD